MQYALNSGPILKTGSSSTWNEERRDGENKEAKTTTSESDKRKVRKVFHQFYQLTIKSRLLREFLVCWVNKIFHFVFQKNK